MRKLLLLLLLVCCQTAPVKREGVRINLFTDPTALDPRLAEGMGSNTVVLELFEGLVRIGPSGEPELALAKEVTVSEDGLEYTFTLRPSKWSNGEPLTAQDFVFGWKEALRPDFPSECAYLLFEIEGAREAKLDGASPDGIGVWAEGPHILHVRLTHPAPYFLHLTTNSLYFPINRKAAKRHPRWADRPGPHFVTNGPFKLVKWEHGAELVTVKNPHYWAADEVTIEEIHHSMIDNSTTEITMFEQKELDWAGGPMSMLPYDAIPSLREEFGVEVFGIDAVYWYQFNTSHPLLKNRKIRQALAYSVRRDELARNLAKGAHQPATGLIPPNIVRKGRDYLGGRGDEEIQALFAEGLEEVGMAGERLPTLTLSTNISEDHLKLAQAMQHRWHTLFGLTVNIDPSEWKVHLGKLHTGSYDIGRFGWYANYRDGVDFLNRFRFPSCKRTCEGWDQESFAHFVDRIDWCADRGCRDRLIAEAEGWLMEEMPVVPLFFLNFNYMKHPDLKGTVFSPFGRVDFRWAFWERSV
ncbi:MAG: peptide ABC transporter substrate-binding protein [Parachlamydiales bacterium]